MTTQQTLLKEQLTLSQITGGDWLAEALELHARIYDELPAEKKHTFVMRGMNYFMPLLDVGQEGSALIGAYTDEGELIGMCAIQIAKDWQEARARNLITYDGSLTHIVASGKSVAAVQALCLSHEAKGKGIGAQLIQAAAQWAMDKGVTDVFAQVAHDNPCSWVQFVKQGFDLVASWTAEHGRYLLHLTKRGAGQVKHSCIVAKEDFYIGAAARDEWTLLFEEHLAAKGRITYHQAKKVGKLLQFDFVLHP